jgi:hypothetical protein
MHPAAALSRLRLHPLALDEGIRAVDDVSRPLARVEGAHAQARRVIACARGAASRVAYISAAAGTQQTNGGRHSDAQRASRTQKQEAEARRARESRSLNENGCKARGRRRCVQREGRTAQQC